MVTPGATAENRILGICALLAILAEVSFIALTGVHFTFPSLPKPEIEHSFTEAEIINVPDEPAHLVAAAASAPAADDESLSKNPAKGSTTKTLATPTTNTVQKGHPLSPTHGPVVIESPSPVIPDYLKSQDINAKVVIQFNVLSSGEVLPKLLVSSGNTELDQIALATAKRWKFYPAEADHKAIDSEVRLRILFQVK
jgi:TonB family protein